MLAASGNIIVRLAHWHASPGHQCELPIIGSSSSESHHLHHATLSLRWRKHINRALN